MSTQHPLAKYRSEAGLSLAQMAARIGVQPNTVWRWEKGRQAPPRSLWQRILDATEGKVSVGFDKQEVAKEHQPAA